MKIHQLPMGARFEYEGKEYVKTGPIFGAGPDGQRLIPKYAVLKPIGEVVAVSPKKADTLSRAAVLKAFEVFYASCEAQVPAPGNAALQAAREEFLGSL